MKELKLFRNHISESLELDESEKIKIFRFINQMYSTPQPPPTDSIGIVVAGVTLEAKHKEEMVSLKEHIGNHLKKMRESNSICRAGMAALIDIGRGTIDVAESPRKTKRTLSFQKLSEINTLYLKAIHAKNSVLSNITTDVVTEDQIGGQSI